jgi:hypothetical protein
MPGYNSIRVGVGVKAVVLMFYNPLFDTSTRQSIALMDEEE